MKSRPVVILVSLALIVGALSLAFYLGWGWEIVWKVIGVFVVVIAIAIVKRFTDKSKQAKQ